MVPSITIFVRHKAACKYRDDELCKRCNCPKHLRWTIANENLTYDNHGRSKRGRGKQYRRSAKTDSWAQAERVRRKLEAEFESGGRPVQVKDDAVTTQRALELFLLEKKTEGVKGGVLKKYERELGRLNTFLEMRSKFFPGHITKELLTEYRATWENLYPSSATRQQVQARVRRFLRFCNEAGWLERIPRLSPIRVDEPPTLPLSQKQYETLLETVPKEFEGAKAQRVRALVQLMRYSALAIRDAVTLDRGELIHDAKKKVYRVSTSRQKTGTHVSVPLPAVVASEILAVLNGNEKYIFWTGSGLEQSAVTNWQHDLRTLFRSAFGQDTRFTPHCLRDTAAVEWLSAGIPLEEVSKLLGHTSVKTTEKSYAPWVTARQDRLDSLVMASWKQ